MNSATSSRKPNYSVIIVTYNSLENIQACLNSLRISAKISEGNGRVSDQEIIVIDNNSRDGTQKFLTTQKDVRTILNKTNNGFSRGCNQGADIATGDYLIFLNPDTLVTQGWADKMVRYFQDPLVGAVGPVSNYVAGLQRLDLNLPLKWKEAKSFPGNGAKEITNTIAGILTESNSGKGVITKLLIGFCLMMHRPLYTTMGGMDENLFLGNDDLDLSWRLRNIGRKLVVATDAFVFHEGQKSFKTEAKSHVDTLTQESTDALYKKLVDYYGGAENLPTPEDLWGIGWFNPSPTLIEELKSNQRNSEATVKSETQSRSETGSTNQSRGTASWKGITAAWKGTTALIFVGPNPNSKDSEEAALPLDRSIATLPSRPSPDILVLNCSGVIAPVEAPAGATLRKLDLGSTCSVKQALEIAVNLIPGSHTLVCLAGVQFTTLFNHWMDKRELSTLPSATVIPVRVENHEPTDSQLACTIDLSDTQPALAFVCRKDWLREILNTLPDSQNSTDFFNSLGACIRSENSSTTVGKTFDSPWLIAQGRDLPNQKETDMSQSNSSWTPVKSESISKLSGVNPKQPSDPFTDLLQALNRIDGKATEDRTPPKSSSPATVGDAFALYPESLQRPMREAKMIGFAGTIAELPSRQGSFKVYDPKGDLVPLSMQDLVILRVTPDLIDNLDQRMANIKRLAKNLKHFIVVFDGSLARKTQSTEANPLNPIDMTPMGVRSALMSSGFVVSAIKPYLGFTDVTTENKILEGWHQVEAVPRLAEYHLDKKVSIIILGFNKVEYTKKCIESIRKYTRQKYELILVDNGSNDDTEKYFRSIPNAKVIINPTNFGVARGWNQGMRIADGDYLLILNNDIIVGPNWLENMVRLAESDPSIGLVGPRSNYIAGPQIVRNVPYKVESEIQDFIDTWQSEHDLTASEFGFIKGFCHLIPRRVFSKIGLYDERYGKGNFEDDDYCMRIHLHDYTAVIAHDSFIHHYGSVSFNQESVDWKALMIENQKKYAQKWAKGRSAINDTLVFNSTSISPSAHDPALVKNEATTAVERLIEAGKKAYDEGKISEAMKNFLEAQSLDPQNAEGYCSLGIVSFHLGKYQDAAILFMKCLDILPSYDDAALNLIDCIKTGNGTVTETEIVTLRIRFPTNRIIQAAFAISTAETPMNSLESIESLIQAGNFSRALDLIETKLRKNEDLGACFNFLGIMAFSGGDSNLALQHFNKSIEYVKPDCDTLYNLCDTYISLGRHGEGLRVLRDAAREAESSATVESVAAWSQTDYCASAEQIEFALKRANPDIRNIIESREKNQLGEKLLREGSVAGAEAIFLTLINEDSQDFRAHNNLGLTAWYQSNGEDALTHFLRALAIRPAWQDGLINTFDTALALGRIENMNSCIDNALIQDPTNTLALAMREHILGDGPSIYAIKNFDELEKGAKELKQAEALIKSRKPGEAITILLAALETRPKNPQALNGLGIIAFSEKKYSDAYGLFEAASALHPLDQDILLNLWQCAQELRREKDVLPKLKLCLEKDPALSEVKAIVKEFA